MPTFSGFSRLSDDCVLEVSGKCDYLRLETRQPYRMALSRNFRANLRKAENKLARQDRPEFIVASRKEDLLEHFEAFLNVEASGWKGTTGLRTAIQLSPPMLQLFTRLIERFSTDQCCRINLLKLNGETAAGQFCLLSGDTLYILKIGYNEKFSKLSPGNLLLNHVIQDAIQNGVIHDINLVTDTPWHSLWNPLSYTVYRAYLFRKTLRGRLALSLVHLRKRLRAINRRWNVLRREG
jgi:CelD/BcsL family acetyltransferase involved in cellulose biosynthesis